MTPLRVVFMGTPPFAVASLQALLANPCCQVVGVVTTPDRPAGRGLQLQPSAVKQYVAAHTQLPLLQPEKLRDPAFHAALDALAADLYVVVAFRMLPEVVFARPRLGSINLHASLLPDLRGAAPINWALMYGLTQTGVSTFRLQATIDTGDLLDQAALTIEPGWDAGALHDALMALGAEVLCQTVCRLARGEATPQPQRAGGTQRPAPKLTPEVCRIDWQRPAAAIGHQVRGLAPQPGAVTPWGGTQLKVYRVATLDTKVFDTEAIAGKVELVQGKLCVGAGDGQWVELLEVQPAGKKRLSVADWLRGRPQLPPSVTADA